MGEPPRRLLLADTTPASRAILEPILQDEGWEMLSVESSFQVLRSVRDANVDLILIDPDLPGSGVSGADVAKTLKGSTQFRHVPVLFLLHGGRQAPAGIAVEGSIELDRWGSARILSTIKQALGPAEPASAEIEAEAPVPSARREGPAAPPPESLVRPLTDLIERLTKRLEAQLSRLLDEQDRRFHDEALRRVSDGARELFAREGPSVIRQEISEQVRAAVERAVSGVAREVVPEIAERLIAQELARLRREYGVE